MCFDLTQIAFSSHIKYLGLIIDKDLNWSHHIDYLTKKLSKALYTLRVLRHSVTSDILLTSYYAYFYSLIKYGIIFWGNSSYAKKIFILQKKAVRILCQNENKQSVRYFSCRGKFKSLGLLTLSSLYIYEVIKFLISHPHNNVINKNLHDHNTRQKNKLHLYRCHSRVKKQSCSYAGTRLYNLLPEEVTNPSQQRSVKNKLKQYLIEGEFYSLSEFENYASGRLIQKL